LASGELASAISGLVNIPGFCVQGLNPPQYALVTEVDQQPDGLQQNYTFKAIAAVELALPLSLYAAI